MAMDRIFLKCNVCNKHIVIAKHFGFNWYTARGESASNKNCETYEEYFNDFFDEHLACFYDAKNWHNISIEYEM